MSRFITAAFLIVSSVIFSQETGMDKSVITKLISEEQYQQAEVALQTQLSFYKNRGSLDSLATFPYYIGQVQLHLLGAAEAAHAAQRFIGELASMNAKPRDLYEASMSLVYFLDEIGQVQWSYDATQEALDYAGKTDDITPEEIGHLEYNLGASALSLGNFDLAAKHFKETLRHYISYQATSAQKLADTYNAMGAVMWLSTQLDSAQFYYEKSLDIIEEMDRDVIDKKYLSAITMANIALIQQSQGQTSAAIKTLQQTLSNYQEVILNTEEENLRYNAKQYQRRSMSNLAAFYNDIGDYKTANALQEYIYESQRKELQPEDPELYKTKIRIGQSLMSLKEYQAAEEVLSSALEAIASSSGDELYWKGIVLFGLAETAEQLGDMERAGRHYVASERAFKNAQANSYDKAYLHFLRKRAFFHAKNKEAKQALAAAHEGYEYTVNAVGEDNFMTFKHILNLADVHFLLEDYAKSLHYSQQGLHLLEKQAKVGSVLDSIQMDFQKPQAILLQTRSAYELNRERDTVFLLDLYGQLQHAVAVLEKRKAVITAAENNSVLIQENSELFEFIKQIGLDLYKQTGNPQYLSEVINYHESSLYNKIRGRLNVRNDVVFSGLPATIIEKESVLKQQLTDVFSMESEEHDAERINRFFEATTAWDTFLSSLRQDYPKYYRMRYETITESTEAIAMHIGNDLTVVRYFFVGESLYVVLLNSSTRELIELDYHAVKSHLERLTPSAMEFGFLHELYQLLWEPFAEKIATNNVTVIPDKELFNLSFETLLTSRINAPTAFATHSLLKKHTLSYHFSLLLLPKRENNTYDRDYTAFAPGFFDSMKQVYATGTNDFLAIDKTYLTLLSQPFTIDLVKAARKRYKGKVFLENQATLSNFKKNARRSKILHIGTHAESDNVSPDYSRLIFAKDVWGGNVEEENSLFAYELYGYDLSSDLTVLTACETGKPEYQAGEGMISLAHAFNYAGSESMLTGLWQIDEQSSAMITGAFYDYLSQGYTKPEALQKAKLDYLGQVEGRMLLPQYWAGLILMGDISPITLEKGGSGWYWLAMIAFLIVLFSLWKPIKSLSGRRRQ